MGMVAAALAAGSADIASADAASEANVFADPLTRQSVDAALAASTAGEEIDQILAAVSNSEDFDDLDPGAAASLAEDSFPELLAPPESSLGSGGDVISYGGTNSAVIAPNGAVIDPSSPPSHLDTPPASSGALSIVESSIPLRGRDDDGALAPIDLGLESVGQHLEPAISGVDSHFPTDLANGIRLPDAGIEITPAGAADATDAQSLNDDSAVFWAEIAEDTDFMAMPTATGLETFVQLRSAASPQAVRLTLQTPAGSRLEQRGPGAAVVSDAGPDALISPPSAIDAAGADVPVKMRVEGDELELSLEDETSSYQFPIAIDPVIDAYDWGANGTSACPSPSGGPWHWTSSRPSSASQPVGFSSFCTIGWGLWNVASAGNYPTASNYSQWAWQGPANTFIEKAEFTGTGFNRNAGDGACAIEGLYNPGHGWEPTTLTSSTATANPWIGNPWVGCDNYSAVNRSHVVGGSATPDGPGGDQEGADNNVAISQLLLPAASTRASSMWNIIWGAKFYVGDSHLPTVDSAPTQVTGWVDDSAPDGTPGNHVYHATASDQGLGVRFFWLLSPDSNTQTPRNQDGTIPLVVNMKDKGCVSVGSCPLNWSQDLSYKLPEGRNHVYIDAFDQLANSSSKDWYELIDRSPPSIAPLGGTVIPSKDNVVSTSTYTVTAAATDGSPASDANLRSGVKKLELFVDDELTPLETTSQECTASDGSCPSALEATWTLDPGAYSDGPHTLKVVATDALGHQRTQARNITVVTDEVDPELDAGLEEDSNGNLVVDTEATDPGPNEPPGSFPSGVTDADLYVDGELVDSVSQACPEGHCSLDETLQLPPGTDPATQTITEYSVDGAGNVSYQIVGYRKARPFPLFGYNDQFAHPGLSRTFQKTMIRRAVLGNANTIRVGVDWCGVQRSDETMFDINALKSYLDDVVVPVNQHATTGDQRLRVILEFYGSPWWARPNQLLINNQTAAANYAAKPPDNTCGGDGQVSTKPGDATGVLKHVALYPPDGAAGHVAAFGSFVAETMRRLDSQPDYNIVALEIWNEPNLQNFWGDYGDGPGNTVVWQDGNPNLMARLFAAAADALSSAQLSRNYQLLTPALTPARGQDVLDSYNHAFFGRVHTEGASSAIDGVAVHLYENMENDSNKAVNAMGSHLRTTMRIAEAEQAPTNSEPWITEIGFPARHMPPPPPAKADLASKANPTSQRKKFKLALQKLSEITSYGPIQSFIVHNLYSCLSPVDGSTLNTCDTKNLDYRGDFGIWGDNHHSPTPKSNLFCLLRDEAKTGIWTNPIKNEPVETGPPGVPAPPNPCAS
jgi:hypothetical protein